MKSSKSSMRRSHNNLDSVSRTHMSINVNPLSVSTNSHSSMYAITGSPINEFISRREHYLEESFEKRSALINRYGFIAPLIDGFNSDGQKKLEINLTDSADLSLHQLGGFSVFFWFMIKKQPGNYNRFIIKRGNAIDELTPAIGILPNGANLFVKINSSKQRIENLFSNKKIEVNRLYSLCVTFSIDYQNDLTDVSLYLDGLLDSQICISGQPMHNQGNLYIGKCDSLNYGFVGFIADVIMVPRVISSQEISFLHKECIQNLKSKRILGSYEIFAKKFEKDFLVQRYSKITGNPLFLIENLDLDNNELREIVKKLDPEFSPEEQDNQNKEDLEKQNENEKIILTLQTFLQSEDSDLSIFCKKASTNARFIYTVLFLINGMEDEIVISRVLNSFEILNETLQINIDEQSFIKLAQILKSYNRNTKCLQTQQFFKNIRFFTGILFPELHELILSNNVDNINEGVSLQFNNRPMSQNTLFLNDMNSVEFHENLLMNSQNFKNYLDDDLEKDLSKSTFTIRTFYGRSKSGQRPLTGPGTGRGYLNSRGNNEEGELVTSNQHFDDIPENKNDFSAVKEEEDEVVNMDNPELNTDKHKTDLNEEDNKDTNKEQKSEEVKEGETGEIKNNDEGPKEDEENKPEVKFEISEKNEDIVKDSNGLHAIHSEENSEKLNKPASETENHLLKKAEEKEPEISDKKENEEECVKLSHSPNPIVNTNLSVQIIDSPKNNNNTLSNTMQPQEELLTNQENKNTKTEANLQEEVDKIEPKYPTDWNEGNFEIVIIHCFDCHLHKTTTRHYENTFVDKFNEVGDYLKSLFPNVKIVGNLSKPDYLSCFDIYLRGVGPNLDENDRFYLFRRIESKRFPSPQEIGDKLISLAMIYGSSINLGTAQAQYMRDFPERAGKIEKISHDHPANLSEQAEKIKEECEKTKEKPPADDPERTKFFCQNWGCGETFVQVDNGPNKCCFHPGVWQFGSYNGYWPEAWSCCERGWGETGCTKGQHNGVRLDKRLMLCLNHGEVNPNSNHPDSACGVFFTMKEAEGCKYHPGYRKGGAFTCCNSENPDGCTESTHATSDWPDEKAKLYFYPKPLINPSDKRRNHVGELLTRCDYFKTVKPYDNPATKMELLRFKRDKEKDELRYCLRWACEKTYKETENSDKSCQCHPGKWDHGSTGTKMVEFIRELGVGDPKSLEKTTILWKPHWTCCRGEWEAPGCRKMKHRGPLMEEYKTNPRKFKWPDPRARLYFPKVVSDKWKNFLNKFMYSESRVRSICRSFFKGGKKTMADLPELCDQLRLYLLVVSDNVEYQLKFMDIATHSDMATKFFVSGGSVDPDKFITWWFLEYEKIAEAVLGIHDKK